MEYRVKSKRRHFHSFEGNVSTIQCVQHQGSLLVRQEAKYQVFQAKVLLKELWYVDHQKVL